MRKALVIGMAIIAVVLLLAIPQANAEGPAARTGGSPGSPAGVHVVTPGTHTRAVGTIQYDNDTPFRRLPNTDDLVGNRFTGMADPHSIASVSFRMAQNYGSDAVMSIWEPNTGQATRLIQAVITGLPAGTVTGVVISYPLAAPITGHNGSFIAGMHNTFFTGYGCPSNSALNGTCDGVALTQGSTTPNRGTTPLFHGAYINLSGGAFNPPTLQVLSTGQNLQSNAIFRVTGDNLPVELMSFNAE